MYPLQLLLYLIRAADVIVTTASVVITIAIVVFTIANDIFTVANVVFNIAIVVFIIISVVFIVQYVDVRLLPKTECLKDTVARALPYWYDVIVPHIKVCYLSAYQGILCKYLSRYVI